MKTIETIPASAPYSMEAAAHDDAAAFIRTNGKKSPAHREDREEIALVEGDRTFALMSGVIWIGRLSDLNFGKKIHRLAPQTQANPEQEQQAGAEVAPGSMPPAVAFFYNNAGYSYGPDQTPAEGRLETAQALANAEARASEAGVCFEWERDVMDAAEWDCAAILGDDILASLGGVDFGKGGEPDASQPYRRVVEAELALEALDAVTAALA